MKVIANNDWCQGMNVVFYHLLKYMYKNSNRV